MILNSLFTSKETDAYGMYQSRLFTDILLFIDNPSYWGGCGRSNIVSYICGLQYSGFVTNLDRFGEILSQNRMKS